MLKRGRKKAAKSQRGHISLLLAPGAAQAEELLDNLTFFYSGNIASGDISSGQDSDTGKRILYFPAWEVLPFDELSPSVESSSVRLATLHSLACLSGAKSSAKSGSAVDCSLPETIVVAPVQAVMQRIVAPALLAQVTISLSTEDKISRNDLVSRLVYLGYSRVTLVEEKGQFAVRGTIVDVFLPDESWPLRIELFFDEVSGLRFFDPETQRSISLANHVHILPVREIFMPQTADEISCALRRLTDRGNELSCPVSRVRQLEVAIQEEMLPTGIEHLMPLVHNETAVIWDYFPASLPVFLYEEAECFNAIDDFSALLHERAHVANRVALLHPPVSLAYEEGEDFSERIRKVAGVSFTMQDIKPGAEDSFLTLPYRAHGSLTEISKHQKGDDAVGYLEPLARRLRQSLKAGERAVIVVSSNGRFARMQELLLAYNLRAETVEAAFYEWYAKNPQSGLYLIAGELRGGFYASEEKLLLVTEGEIFPESARRTRKLGRSRKKARRLIDEISKLSEGDHIVHIDHGIGIYRGLNQLTVEGITGDYVYLEYADGAKLYLPVDQISRVQRYVGAEGKAPSLSRLGSPQWAKTKEKVKERVAEFAGRLLALYAEREIVKGVHFGEVDSDDKAFADAFPYEETPDQEQAIKDVLADMASDKPMDRLVCGDTGYGKTEVALRAAYKAVSAGYQVAVLVPTTILADQHFETFKRRFLDFPVRIGCLSRFFSAAENRATLDALSEGQLDIIIGTHRLLQKDVKFSNLGLLVIDEEHRFGVAHKEKLKRYKAAVDILTLTATPIPRTLHMSLVSIRDLSVIETPPTDRHAIRTYLAPYTDEVVREAVMREVSRGGQVYYIHNRVQNIALVVDELRELLPEVKIDYAHGQMKETQLEDVMHRFFLGKVDLLVCTTIVESGLDVPNANTIIVREADCFGLAQLYQLRGRVGRSSRRAYAYLLVKNMNALSDDAKKRLKVLQALDDLGMGFRLALQDMEIRGAGNLLGQDQSGEVVQVGYEMYSRILREAVHELHRGKERAADESSFNFDIDPEIIIGFAGYIPVEYVPDVSERLILYQRLTQIRDESDGRNIFEEMCDRFGNPPPVVHSLIERMLLRVILCRVGVVRCEARRGHLRLQFHPDAGFDPQLAIKAVMESGGMLRLSPKGILDQRLRDGEGDSIDDISRLVLDLLGRIAGV